MLAPTGVYDISPTNPIGPAGSSLEEMKSGLHYDEVFGVAAVVGLLVVGGVVFLGISFKTSAVIGAYSVVYGFAAGFMEAFLAQLLHVSTSINPATGLPIPFLSGSEILLITGVLTAVFGFIGVWGAIQLAGSPTGPMD